MTLDDATALLAAKGYTLGGIIRLAPELGYFASARSAKYPLDVEKGESGYGKTHQAALEQLVGLICGPEAVQVAPEALKALSEALRGLRDVL